jgi:cysteine synthase A
MNVSDGFTGADRRYTAHPAAACLSDETGCKILGKAEFMNPGRLGKGSGREVDRAWMPKRRGNLKPGGTVVEGTAGNTGIGMAHVCNARGYQVCDCHAG